MSQTTPNGYRKRPWELTILSVFFALVPLLSWLTQYLSLIAAGREVGPWEVLASFFGTWNYGPWGMAHALLMGALWVLFLVVAWGIYRVAGWGFWTCILSAGANSLFSMVLYGISRSPEGVTELISFSPFQVGVALNLVFFVPIIVLLRQKLMAPFFNPRMKWWEQHPRVKAQLRIEATIAGERKVYQSFDISASGMFLGTSVVPPVVIGDTFPATIHLEAEHGAVEVVCKVVWVSDGKGRAAPGCGVTFEYPARSHKKILPRYIKSQIQAGHLLERT